MSRAARSAGTVGGNLRDVLDGVEVSEADTQEEIELAVIQITAVCIEEVPLWAIRAKTKC